MIKVFGKRGSGKTSKLLELAHEHGYVLAVPTYRMARYVVDMRKEKGFDDVKIITLNQFLEHNLPFGNDKNYLFDELDICLHYLGVDGYSNTDEELTGGQWIWTSYDQITCLNCGFTHKDEVFMLTDDADGLFTNGYLYCPKCGTKMNGFKPDGHWFKEEDLKPHES